MVPARLGSTIEVLRKLGKRAGWSTEALGAVTDSPLVAATIGPMYSLVGASSCSEVNVVRRELVLERKCWK